MGRVTGVKYMVVRERKRPVVRTRRTGRRRFTYTESCIFVEVVSSNSVCFVSQTEFSAAVGRRDRCALGREPNTGLPTGEKEQ